MKMHMPDKSTILGSLLAAQVASPSQHIANLDRGGWKILPVVTDTPDLAAAPVPAFTRYTLPVESSDNFDGSDRKLAEPGAGLTQTLNEIESGESKNQAQQRAGNETTSGNFSNRLRDEASGKFDRNYSLRSISTRK